MDDLTKELDLTCKINNGDKMATRLQPAPIETRVDRLELKVDQLTRIQEQQTKVTIQQSKQIDRMERVMTQYQTKMENIVKDGFGEIKNKLDAKQEGHDRDFRDLTQHLFSTFLPKTTVFWLMGIMIGIASSVIGMNIGYTYVAHTKIAVIEKEFNIHDKLMTHRYDELIKNGTLPSQGTVGNNPSR